MVDFELNEDPPPFSMLPGRTICNRATLVGDSKIEARSLWIAVQLMTDLNRFTRNLDRLGLAHDCNLPRCDLKVLKTYAHDFYDSWHVSSSEIIHELGLETTLRILRSLRPFYFITWRSDVMTWIENGWFSEQLRIFRGQAMPSSGGAIADGLSWTLNKGIAEAYARRFSHGVVYHAIVEFDNVLLVDIDEQEIVADPTDVSIDQCEEYVVVD